MKIKSLSKAIVFFVLVTALPILKVFLLGEYDSGEQQKYIRLYFWLQFLVPMIDLGFYWSFIRQKVIDGDGIKNSYGFSSFGLLLSLILLPFDLLYSLLVLLATVTAWYNFRLQTLRIDGESAKYYLMRMSKVSLDIVFVFAFFSLDTLNVGFILLGELLAVFVVVASLIKQDGLRSKIHLLGFGGLFSLDYFYTVLKVLRSNIARILLPFVFVGQGVEGILFAVLFYELMAQYLSIEKLRDLLEGKINVIACLLAYLFSLPFQYVGVYMFAKTMSWNFGVLEILCVMLGGSARIFSIYTLNIIKEKAFGVLVYLNFFLVIFAVLEIYSVHKLTQVESAAQISLLVFYGVEALVGLGLIVWLEMSKTLKRT